MAPDEAVMLSVKYQSPRIANIPAADMPLHAAGLLLRICAITGWILPEQEFLRNTLTSEFEKYLIENYSHLNVDEISYAFRNYGLAGNDVKDWGKNMNLQLINIPISKYLAVRQCLSEQEERKTTPQLTHSGTANWKPVCEHYYQKYLAKKYDIAEFPWQMYDEFVSESFMAADAWEDFVTHARVVVIGRKKLEYTAEQQRQDRLPYDERSLTLSHSLRRDLENMSGCVQSEKLEQWAKRLAVQYLYGEAEKKGYKCFFVEENDK